MSTALSSRPQDATLSVQKAARLLGVHANTIRAWSDQGRLRFYRINARGDRRYRLGDLQRFLDDAASASERPVALQAAASGWPARQPHGGHPWRPRPAENDGRGGDAPRELTRTAEAYPGTTPAGATAAAAATQVPPGLIFEPPTVTTSSPLAEARRSLDLRVLVDVARLAARDDELDRTLGGIARLLCDAYGYPHASFWERRGDALVPRPVEMFATRHRAELAAATAPLARSLETGRVLTLDPREMRELLAPGVQAGGGIAVPVAAGSNRWGVMLVALEPGHGDELGADLLEAVASELAVALARHTTADDLARQLHREEALRRVAADIGTRLDVAEVLAALVDHAMVLFGADRAAVFLVGYAGRVTDEASRNLSDSYLAAARTLEGPSLAAAAIAAGRPLFATGYSRDLRSGTAWAAAIQEGFDTLCCAPLADVAGTLGVLKICHDRPHPWTAEELETLEAFVRLSSGAVRTARNFAQMATWAAQLQSIQALGARLNRLTSVREIGLAIATELRQLIDYHNVRVYRIVDGTDLVPVAMQGQVGEYMDETADQLRIAVGQGITGWVAAHGVAENLPDAAADTRATTIPGTEPDLDESMLLAPMTFEDQVLGVLVLSKLGLHQFTDDDLRLLVIYASLAAQAMANADATQRLEEKSAALARQLLSQRELLSITESILTTLDSAAILEQITERLGALVRYDTVAISIVDRPGRLLRPLTAKGVHADAYLAAPREAGEGLEAWVIEHNESQLVPEELADQRIRRAGDDAATDGSLIVVPLRGREGATGVLTLERLGATDRFTEEEFELVKLFAAQVSIALQNAEIHRDVEIRAQTDALTGLLNHGTFEHWLERLVREPGEFSLIMVDLDDFRVVNNELGHQAGDRFLRRMAAALVAAGRESDRVFRYGGDEFAILLSGTDTTGAAHVAERVRRAMHEVTERHPVTGEAIKVTGSVGVATFPRDGQTASEVLLAADLACFVSKRGGQDQVTLASESQALEGEFSLQEPTPVDPPWVPVS